MTARAPPVLAHGSGRLAQGEAHRMAIIEARGLARTFKSRKATVEAPPRN
jgi:hypothetical protein